MGIIKIEKDKPKENSFIDESKVIKPNQKVDNLAEMDKAILERKKQIDMIREQEKEALRVKQIVEEQKKKDLEAQKKVEEDYIKSLDPLNNATNPMPVNPKAPVEEKTTKEKLKFFDIISFTLGMIYHPGDMLDEKPDMYGNTSNGIKFAIFSTIWTIVLSLVGRVLLGLFIKTYNSVTGSYTTRIGFDNILTLDYSTFIVNAVVVSGVSILIVSLIYYLSSFFNNKGVSFGEYLLITNLSFISFLVGYSILLPLGCIVHYYLGYALLGVSVIYTLVCFISGINNELKFRSNNRKIIYNAFNLSVIFLVIAFVVYMVYFSGNVVISSSIIF